jgi:ABC-type multidrug transport system fused ATPase/permease subunit
MTDTATIPGRRSSILKVILRAHIFRIVACGLCAAGIAIMASLDPLLMRHLIDRSLPNRDSRNAIFTIACIAGCFLTRSVLSSTATLFGFRAKQLIGQDLRVATLTHMSNLSAAWHERVKLGEKLCRLDSDIEEVAYVSSTCVHIVSRAGLFFVLNLFIMSRLSPKITLCFLPVLPLFLCVRKYFQASIRTRSDSSRNENGKALAGLAEHLSAITQLELLGAGNRRLTATVHGWSKVLIAQWRVRTVEVLFSFTVTTIFSLSVLVVLGLSVHEVIIGHMSTGTMVAFYAYLGSVFEPISTLMDLYSQSQKMVASLARVQEVLGTVPSIIDCGEIDLPHRVLTDGIHLQDVDFTYSSSIRTLRNINLKISSGQLIGLVGRSGSGKSTLARLLVRLIEPDIGSICLDGRQLRDYSFAALRKSVCYLPQRPILFAGTLRENLLYGDPVASDAKLHRVIEAVQLREVVRRLPLGLESELGPDGATLSGGEQQRVAIARALLRDAAVVVLDEATSALDIDTEKLVLQALTQFKPLCTIVVITHRLQSLQSADSFVLLDEGEICAQGHYKELLSSNLLFRQLYEYGNRNCTPDFGSEYIEFTADAEISF